MSILAHKVIQGLIYSLRVMVTEPLAMYRTQLLENHLNLFAHRHNTQSISSIIIIIIIAAVASSSKNSVRNTSVIVELRQE